MIYSRHERADLICGGKSSRPCSDCRNQTDNKQQTSFTVQILIWLIIWQDVDLFPIKYKCIVASCYLYRCLYFTISQDFAFKMFKLSPFGSFAAVCSFFTLICHWGTLSIQDLNLSSPFVAYLLCSTSARWHVDYLWRSLFNCLRLFNCSRQLHISLFVCPPPSPSSRLLTRPLTFESTPHFDWFHC